MDRYYVVFCKGRYPEDGITINEYCDIDEVNAFLTEFIIGKDYKPAMWIFFGQKLQTEQYQIATKVRIKVDEKGEFVL